MILLRSDAGESPIIIINVLHLSKKCVWATRKKYFEGGLDSALYHRQGSARPKIVSPTIEAYITAIACEQPPAGHKYMTIELIQETLEKRYGIRLGWGTVKNVLHDHQLKPWGKKCGASLISMPNTKPE